MVGLAFEIHDHYKDETIKSDKKNEESRIINSYISNYNIKDINYNNIDTTYNLKDNYNLNKENIRDNPNYNLRDNYNSREIHGMRLRGDRNVMSEVNGSALNDSREIAYKEATFFRFFTYSYCFVGFMTGPYYTYKTYDDMVSNTNSKHLNCNKHLLATLKFLPFSLIVFCTISNLYSLETVRTATFLGADTPFLTRISYMVLMFAMFRARLYIAWLLSEMVCVMACLGIYPVSSQPRCGVGPTNLVAYFDWLQISNKDKIESEQNFESIKNLNIYGCELSPTFRQGMKSWNMSVQYWLAAYIYKRIPVRTSFIRVTVTMFVSAYWHGIHPGYFLSFLLMPCYLACEDLFVTCFKNSRWAKSVVGLDRFNKVCWLVKMRLLEYTSMGFLLLQYTDTINYWDSIFFCGHVFIPLWLGAGVLWKAFQWLSSRKERSVGGSGVVGAALNFGSGGGGMVKDGSVGGNFDGGGHFVGGNFDGGGYWSNSGVVGGNNFVREY